MITSTHYRSLQDFKNARLPIRLHEKSSMDGLLRPIGMVGVLALLLIAPPAVVYAIFMLGEANFSSLHDGVYRVAAISAAAAILFPMFFKGLLARLIGNLGRRRIVTINETQVTVREESLFKTTEWREPLIGYRGVECSSRGRRHQLILSHPQPERQISLWVGDQVPEALVAGYNNLLSCTARRR